MLLLSLQFALDSSLLTLVFLVQRLIYPSFQFLDEASFRDWHRRHTSRMGQIVIPLMLGQLVLSLWRTWTEPGLATGAHTAAIAAAWASTFLLSVPCHKRLASLGRDSGTIRRLVAGNRVRLAAWAGAWAATLAALTGW
jgi:hypothetical protein